jgi:V-type H+-transporting ATPase subunit F
MIRPMIDAHEQAFPTVLEIPSKDHPYDPSKVTFLDVGFSFEENL